eukprot:CAMPEP_0178429430 /NCGR_PEP_ID=MMETSP0689_2-20121128/30797_1 /TAXON_ID=160604 /ORGANISM="Amphidinium massartii, Strain CS-259" /LENGTH=433 /DNA_ID=CAMNT_0020051249 /DNA_START=59 /DNA_END=1356 /DNA_ORIENTATION=+
MSKPPASKGSASKRARSDSSQCDVLPPLTKKSCGCPNACSTPSSFSSGCPIGWSDVPRLQKTPDMTTFLSQYAVPRRPCIFGADVVRTWGWPAVSKELWQDIRYIEEHPQVNAMERLFDSPEGFRPVALRASQTCGGSPSHGSGVSCPMTPKEALQTLRSRSELQKLGGDGIAMYLGAWEYDADDWWVLPDKDDASIAKDVDSHRVQGLSDDLKPGVPFARCQAKRALGEDHRFLRCLRWMYIGEPGSGTSSHTDPLATHGWMFQAKGKKRWRLLRWFPEENGELPRSWREVPGLVSVPDGVPDDMFSPESCAKLHAWRSKFHLPLHSESAWACELTEGEVIFVPSCLLHAVQNVGVELSLAVSHNWVDASNVSAVLACLEGALQLLQQTLAAPANTGAAKELTAEDLASALLQLEVTLGPQAKELVQVCITT